MVTRNKSPKRMVVSKRNWDAKSTTQSTPQRWHSPESPPNHRTHVGFVDHRQPSKGNGQVFKDAYKENLSPETSSSKEPFTKSLVSEGGLQFETTLHERKEDSKSEVLDIERAPPLSCLSSLPSRENEFARQFRHSENNPRDEFPAFAKERTVPFGSSPIANRNTTALHELCGNISTSDDLLRAKSFLKKSQSGEGSNGNIASKIDFKGRTPLHCFSCNKVLATAIGTPGQQDLETKEYLKLCNQPSLDPETNLERDAIRFLVCDLLASNPGAMVIRDDDGFIPFQSALVDWINLGHDRGAESQASEEAGYLPDFSSYTRAVSQVWGSTSTTFLSAVKRASRTLTPGDRDSGFPTKFRFRANDAERCESVGATMSPDRLDQSKSESQTKLACGDLGTSTSNRVALTPQSRFALIMLSAVIDQLDNSISPDRFGSVTSSKHNDLGYDFHKESFERAMREMRTYFRNVYGSVDISSIVVQTVASIPHIIKTILLIRDDEDKKFALSTSIIRRAMLSKHSVGPWLTEMLQSEDRELSQRSVDYLKSVSDECSGSKKIEKNENPMLKLLVDEVSNLQDFIPALLALGDRGIEEASTTLIVKRVLDQMISRPFAVTVVLCDAIFLALLITAFRYAVGMLISGDSLKVVLQWIYIANTGIFYFIIREIGKMASMFLISRRAREYFLSFWNLIDVLATVLALSSTISMRNHFTFQELGLENTAKLRGLLAITTGFLWLRVLSLLKAINMQLATFVLAILQIMKDIIWFCVILLTLVVSFSQMFFTLLAPSSCAKDTTNMQCRETEYLLRVYTILLGDFGGFEREQFTSGLSVFLLVFYSFLVTVVLLNVLIAIASDSYEKCLVRAQNLFGRARVMLIAELDSFQNLLRKTDGRNFVDTWWTSGPWSQGWSRGSILFFCISVTVIVGWTFAELLGFARGERFGNIFLSLLSVVVNVVLFTIIMTYLARGADSIKSKSSEDSESADGCVQRAVLRLLGASRGRRLDDPRKKRYFNEWNGRVHYLQREMSRIAEEQTAQVEEQNRHMESLISSSESRLWTHLLALEEDMRLLRANLVDAMKETKQTNDNITNAVGELKGWISSAALGTGKG